MLLNHEQTNLIHSFSSSLWVGCSSEFHFTEIVRLSGAHVTEDGLHLDLFAPQKQCVLFFQYIQQNPKISFLCSSILSFETLQVKGLFVNHRKCTTEESEAQKIYLKNFSQNVISIGVKKGEIFNDYLQDPLIAIRIKGEEVFDQTPRFGAGKKIS